MNDTTSPTDDVYSMDEFEQDLKKAKGGRRTLWFLAGLLIGIAGTLVLPPLLRPYLPDSLRGSQELAIGPVLAEQREGDRLLLTVQAEQGAMLATFTERVPEIDLLVGVGDTVTLGVPRYQPFVENPSFEGVKKADSTSEGPSTDQAGADESGSDDATQEGAVSESGSDEPGRDETPGPIEPDSAEASAAAEGDSGAEGS
jgi:hypothetical protein